MAVMVLSTAQAGVSDVVNHCEFFLDAAGSARYAVYYLKRLLPVLTEPTAVYLDQAPREMAFWLLGMDDGRANSMKMFMTADPSFRNVFWLHLIGNDRKLFETSIHFPPVYVWKQLSAGGMLSDEIELDPTLSNEDPASLSLGFILDSGSYGRKFLLLSRLNEFYIRLSLGLDVDCSKLPLISRALPIERVFSSSQVLCRVRVVSADFRAPLGGGG